MLPLIAAYQRFYGAEPDAERNREFFRTFVDPSDRGMLLGAWEGSALVGHACLYWTFSSVGAVDAVLMNDLYVSEQARGGGVGKALIDAAVEVSRQRGADHLSWETALDNRRAQRLYERMGAERNVWFEYSIATGPSS